MNTVNNRKQCDRPTLNQFEMTAIDAPTLTPESGVHPLQKDLYLELNTTCDEGKCSQQNIYYQWSLQEVRYDVSVSVLQS